MLAVLSRSLGQFELLLGEGFPRAILQLGASLRFPIAFFQKVLMTQANAVAKPQSGTVSGHCSQHIFMSEEVAPTIYRLPWSIIGRISAQGTLLKSAQTCERWSSNLRIASLRGLHPRRFVAELSCLSFWSMHRRTGREQDIRRTNDKTHPSLVGALKKSSRPYTGGSGNSAS